LDNPLLCPEPYTANVATSKDATTKTPAPRIGLSHGDSRNKPDISVAAITFFPFFMITALKDNPHYCNGAVFE
jgi:hypothetical protein